MSNNNFRILPINTAVEEIFEEMISAAFNKDNFSNYPPTDVYHENNISYVEIALAKFTIEDITVELINKVLIIKGRKAKKEQIDNRIYLNKSIATRNFERKLNVPFQVEEINYELKNGILYLEIIPKIVEQNEIKISNKKINHLN